MISALCEYAGVDWVGYHHFEHNFLQCKLVDYDGHLICLTHRESMVCIAAGCIDKT